MRDSVIVEGVGKTYPGGVEAIRETRFHVGRKIPESLLERAKRFFASFIDELFVRLARLPFVLTVLKAELPDLLLHGWRE